MTRSESKKKYSKMSQKISQQFSFPSKFNSNVANSQYFPLDLLNKLFCVKMLVKKDNTIKFIVIKSQRQTSVKKLA